MQISERGSFAPRVLNKAVLTGRYLPAVGGPEVGADG